MFNSEKLISCIGCGTEFLRYNVAQAYCNLCKTTRNCENCNKSFSIKNRRSHRHYCYSCESIMRSKNNAMHNPEIRKKQFERATGNPYGTGWYNRQIIKRRGNDITIYRHKDNGRFIVLPNGW